MDKACILDLDVLALEFFMVVSPSHSSISSVKTLVSLTRCSSKEALAQDPCCNITIFDSSGLYPKTHRHFKVVTDDSYWVVDLIARHENLLKSLLQNKKFYIKKKKKKRHFNTFYTITTQKSLFTRIQYSYIKKKLKKISNIIYKNFERSNYSKK
jgi:hypothetical protein